MPRAKVSVDALIVCDDVRREANSKVLLIGVWPLEFTIPQYPTNMDFVVHCQGAVIEGGEIEPRLRVLDDAGGTLYDSDISDRGQLGHFIKGRYGIEFGVSLQLTRNCELVFKLKIGDEELQAATRRVVLIEDILREREQQIKN